MLGCSLCWWRPRGHKLLIPTKPYVPGVYIQTLELLPYVPRVARNKKLPLQRSQKLKTRTNASTTWLHNIIAYPAPWRTCPKNQQPTPLTQAYVFLIDP